jgi:hypothetical protein
MRKFYIAILVLLLLMTMVLPVGVANAGSGQVEVNGTFTMYMTLIPSSLKILGQGRVIIVDFVDNIEYSGSFDGPATETVNTMKNLQSGAFSSVGTQEFDGMFMGQPGAFTSLVRHQGGMDDIAKIEMTVISGTDACENLHGTLIFMAYPVYYGPYPDHYEGTYSGTLHFAP